MSNRPMVALVCGNVYPHFDFSVPAVGGGMETRAAIFGRGLAAGGRWQVSFVVSDFGQDFVTRHENIDFHIYQTTYRRAGRNVFPRLRRRDGASLLRLDRSDLSLLWQVPLIVAWLALPGLFFPRFWRRLQPAVVCCFGNNAQSAEVIADCRRIGIRTLLLIASDEDLSPDYQPGNHQLNRYCMPKWKGHYSLTHADCIVVQTEAQLEALQRYFGRDAALIRNPVHISPDDSQHWLPRDARKFVLWIGSTDGFNKRPMLFLELARDCPDLQFIMIASCTDDAVFHALEQARPANLRILKHVPAHEIWNWLRGARVLVNTSRFEGFPNTFLQAAVMGVPIVSLEVDPGSMLEIHGCGISVCGDPQELRKATSLLYIDHNRAEHYAKTCHSYVLARHEASGRTAELAACLEEVRGKIGKSPIKQSWLSILNRFV